MSVLDQAEQSRPAGLATVDAREMPVRPRAVRDDVRSAALTAADETRYPKDAVGISPRDSGTRGSAIEGVRVGLLGRSCLRLEGCGGLGGDGLGDAILSAVTSRSGTSAMVTSSTAMVVCSGPRSAARTEVAGAAFAAPAAIAVSATPAADAKAIEASGVHRGDPSTTAAAIGRRAWR